MDLKKIVGLSVLIICIVGYFLFEQSKKTTYEEVILNLINEDEEIEQITVYSQIPLVTKTASSSVNDPELINKIMNEQIRLKKVDTRKLPVIMTTLVIKTDKESYEVGFDGGSIMIGSERYLTINPELNTIYMTIVKEKLDWEIIEFTPVPWR